MSLENAFDPGCPCCVERNFVFLDAEESSTAMLCGRNAVQIRAGSGRVDLDELRDRLSVRGDFGVKSGVLRGILSDERSPTDQELSLIHI